MNSFKDIAYQILKTEGKPLHSQDITEIALSRGLLQTAGKTPEATMNAALTSDTNSKKEKSRFRKVGPSKFELNQRLENEDVQKKERIYKVSKNVSSKQKGDIAEARIAELITLYGDTTLSCYKPVSDDDGIDLIVKEKGSLKTMYIQIKSRFGDSGSFTATTKDGSMLDNHSMAIIFCLFDTEEGDLADSLWFVPAPDFLKNANKVQHNGNKLLSFVAGRQKKESNKWNDYLIEKMGLANRIIEEMKRLS